MTQIELEIYDDVVATLNKIRDINDEGVELLIPQGSVLLDNVLNLKLIKRQAEKYGITAHFTTDDEIGNNLLNMIEDGTETIAGTSPIIETENHKSASMFAAENKPIKKLKVKLPKISLPRINFKRGFNPFALAGIVIALLIVGGMLINIKTQKATIVLHVDSQPLTRSITLRVKESAATDGQAKILKGTKVSASVESTKPTTSTGTKLVGKRATGKAMIYNRTDSTKEFKEGTVLVFDNDTKDLEFELADNITVPAASLEDPADPASSTIPGKAEVEITAKDIGTAFNIKADETLNVKNYKKTEFTSKTSADLTGGKSETVTVVSETDIAKAKEELASQVLSQSEQVLKQKIGSAQQLITGSQVTTPIKETLTAKVGDEVKEFSVTTIATVEALTYLKKDLDNLLDQVVQDFVPQGYMLSTKERDIKVEVLGKSTSSVLSSTEADIQVTLKTFVVPDINTDDIKKQISGKTIDETNKYLGSLGGIKTFEFNLKRGFIPIGNRVPKDITKIDITVKRDQ